MNNAVSWKIALLLAVSVASACSVYMNTILEQRYGHLEPRQRIVDADSQAGLFYRRSVKPVLEQRCVVCHGCYDAPCQLKLSSLAGVDRGASKEQVYSSTRLKAAMPSRLYEDEKTTSGWRQRSFYPVLNERDQLASINLEASLLYRMLALKRIDGTMGVSASYLPQVAFLKVTGNSRTYYYTVLHNNAHSNITSLFREDKYRLPKNDSITVVRGFIGAYPDAFWEVDEMQLADFADSVVSLQKDADYSSLVDKFGVRRTDSRFWSIGDEFTAAYKTMDPIHAGLFDYNRLENR